MLLEGSCHCGAVSFKLQSQHPVPYMRCYCGICRKTSGGGGFLINLSGDARTLEVEGRENVRVYQAMLDDGKGGKRKSRHERHFCSLCGTHLWAFNERWPELVHPVAGAVDTPLPEASENVHIMLEFKPDWVALEGADGDGHFQGYPDESIAGFHDKRGLTVS